MRDLIEQYLDDDPAYAEWSDTIEKQNQEQLEADLAGVTVIDLSQKSWDEVLEMLK